MKHIKLISIFVVLFLSIGLIIGFNIDKKDYKDNNKVTEEINYEDVINTWYELTNNSYIVLNDLYLNKYENAPNVKIINNDKDKITLKFIGDVSLADNWYIMPAYNERKQNILGILSQDVVDELNDADVSVCNNEFTISTRGTPMKGKAFTFRADPKNLSVYNEMGIDLVTLANNHVYDFGSSAFLDMLDALDEVKMPHVGAGRNLEEASIPYYFIINGKKIAFLNASRAEKNIMTPWASEDKEGILNCYDSTYFIDLIKKTKQESDYVITLVHWGKEAYHTLEDVQLTTSKEYLNAGSDAIIGTHAHVLQGMELVDNKLIAYNLGDFIFNAKTIDTGILSIEIDKNGNFTYYFKPCLESDKYTKIADEENKGRILNDLTSYSINVTFDESGQIKNK